MDFCSIPNFLNQSNATEKCKRGERESRERERGNKKTHLKDLAMMAERLAPAPLKKNIISNRCLSSVHSMPGTL
jgi:hypothetical protein